MADASVTLAYLKARPVASERNMKRPAVVIAVQFLNDNFAPWEFVGDEPVALALEKILQSLVDENEELRRQLDSLTDAVVMYTAPEAIKQGDTVMVRVPRRYVVRP